MLLFSLAGCAFWRQTIGTIIGSEGSRKASARTEGLNHFLAATMYEKKGEMEQAIRELRTAAELAPDSPTLSLRLIRAYVRVQDYENARLAAERAATLLPNNANVWIVLGEIYHQLNEYDKAVEAFQKAVAVDPENLLGYGALASIQEGSNDYVAAIDIYKRLAELTPNSAAVHYQLGLSLARINDKAGAQAELERALELKPKLARARFMLGVLHLDANENEAAVEQLKQYVKVSPDDVRAAENLAGALSRMKQYDQAYSQLTEIMNGKHAEPRHALEAMYVLLRADRYREVEALVPSGGAPVFGSLFRAFARCSAGDPFAPVVQSLDAIEGDTDEECSSFLNDIIYLFGKDDAGTYFVSTLNAIRSAGPASKTVDIVLARTLMALDRHAEAEAVLKAALEHFGPDKALHYGLAVVYEKLKQIPETEQQLKAYLKLQPDDPEVLNFLGYLYADHNMKLDEAETLLKRALEIKPENGYYLDSLGWVYYRKGDADRAIELIRKAILAMDSDDAELRNHLGDAYLLKGDTDKAIAEWNRAYRLDPKLEGVKEKLDKYRK